MAKDMPKTGGGSTERLPWQNKPYPFRLLKSEERDNRFFSEEAKCKSCKEHLSPTDHSDWIAGNLDCCPKCKGKDFFPADDDIERTQFMFTFECLDGDKKGDWLFVFAPHYFGISKKDGTVKGKRGQIADAMGLDITLGLESDNSDMIGKVLNILVKPKADDKTFGKAESFFAMDTEERMKYALGATVTSGGGKPSGDDDIGPDIPFLHLPYDRLGETRCGHSRF